MENSFHYEITQTSQRQRQTTQAKRAVCLFACLLPWPSNAKDDEVHSLIVDEQLE
jgi:hypothetical protein